MPIPEKLHAPGRGAGRGRTADTVRPRAAGTVLLPLALLLVFCSGGSVSAGALPVLDWNSRGGVDWSSGYIVGYGTASYGPVPDGREGARTEDGVPGRNEALRKARRSAVDSIYRFCLGLTIQEKLRVRDYLRDDPDLRADLRRAVKAAPTWAVQLRGTGELSVAVLYPVGGSGLSGLLGRIKGWYGEEGWRPEGPLPLRPATEGEFTGMVIVVDATSFSPVLRPRIVGRDGTTLVSFERSGKTALERAAFIPYYSNLAKGLADPLLGENPLQVWDGEVRGTDIVIPTGVERLLVSTSSGRMTLEDVKMIVVRQ